MNEKRLKEIVPENEGESFEDKDTLSIAKVAQARSLVEGFVRKYTDAKSQAERDELEEAVRHVLEEKGLETQLLEQALTELREREKKLLRIKEELKDALSLVLKMFTRIMNESGLHVLNQRQAEEVFQNLKVFQSRVDQATDPESLSTQLRKFDGFYQDRLYPALQRARLSLNGYYRDRVPDYIYREDMVLKVFLRQLEEIRVKLHKMQIM